MRFQQISLVYCIFIIIFVCNIDVSFAKKNKKKKPNNSDKNKPSNNSPPPNPSAVKSLLGNNVQTNLYDGSTYDGKNGEASSPDDLKCDFESNCCWKNTKPPYDTMDWVQASGTPDSDKLQNNFGTSTAPSGNFLMVSSDKPAGDNDKAEFESCSIPCSGDNMKVTLKHWTSQGVKLQICQIPKSDPTLLLTCQDVPSTSPGPDTITLPSGSNLIVSIVASGFTASGGSVAMIDDITVDYPPCSITTPGSGQPAVGGGGTTIAGQGPPPSGNGGACCTFEKDTCNWSKGNGPSSPMGTVNDFTSAGPERFKNPATGVPPSRDRFFLAAYLKPKESAYTECQTNFGQDTIIRFEEYKATQDLNLKVCCDTDHGCTYDTGGKVEKTDFRQWYAGSVKCPAGTKKVIFYSENNGMNEGGVGIDNIHVEDMNGQALC